VTEFLRNEKKKNVSTVACLMNEFSTYALSSSIRVQTSVYSRLLLEKLIIAQLLRIIPPFMEIEGPLPRSQDPATGPYTE
jgi:hypothetical protein